ncbi:TPA: hypothetical protein ACS7XC_000295 [Providencia alcalifaciens]
MIFNDSFNYYQLGLKRSFCGFIVEKKLFGVIKNRTIALAECISDERKNRYHMNDDDLIELESGEVIAISNQWGIGNIERVLDFFSKDGFVVEKVEVEQK